MAKPVENGYEKAQEHVVTPAKSKAKTSTSNNRSTRKQRLSPGALHASPSSSSSTSELQTEQGIQQFLLDAMAPITDALSSTISSATNSVTTDTESLHEEQDSYIEPLSYYTPLSPIEHTAPLVDHSACNKSKAQKKQEKKERKKELKRERQEIQQNRLLEQQEKDIDEKFASPFWDLSTAMAGAALSAAEPFVTPYTSSSYFLDDEEDYDYDDEEDDEDDEDDFSFENLEAIKIKKSNRKSSSKQSSTSSPKKKSKKKNKPKRRGWRVNYEEPDEGDESATDGEEADPTTPSKRDVAARVEAIFANKELILKDFDDYIAKTAEDLRISETKQEVRERRFSSSSTSYRKNDRRGRSQNMGTPKKVRSKSVGANTVRKKSRSKSRDATDDIAIIAQSFDDIIELMLTDTSRSLLNRKDTLESKSGRGKSDSKLGKLQRSRSSNPTFRRSDKNKIIVQEDNAIEVLLVAKKKDKNRSAKGSSTEENYKNESSFHAKEKEEGRSLNSICNMNSTTSGTEKVKGESPRKNKKDSRETKTKDDHVKTERSSPHHRRVRSNSFAEGDNDVSLSGMMGEGTGSNIKDTNSSPRDRRLNLLKAFSSIEQKEQKKNMSVSPKPRTSRKAASARNFGDYERTTLAEEDKSSKPRTITSTPRRKLSQRASELNFTDNEAKKRSSGSPKPKASHRAAPEMNITDHAASELNFTDNEAKKRSSVSPKPKSSRRAAPEMNITDHEANARMETERKASRKDTKKGSPFRSRSVSDHTANARMETERKASRKDTKKGSPSRSRSVTDHTADTRMETEGKPSRKDTKKGYLSLSRSVTDHTASARMETEGKPSRKDTKKGYLAQSRSVTDHTANARMETERKPSRKDTKKGSPSRSRSVTDHTADARMEKEEKPSRKDTKKGSPSRSRSVSQRSAVKSLGIEFGNYLTEKEIAADEYVKKSPHKERLRKDDSLVEHNKVDVSPKKPSPSKGHRQTNSEDVKKRESSRSKSQSAHRQRISLEEAGSSSKNDETEDTKKNTPTKDRSRKATDEGATLELTQNGHRRRNVPLEEKDTPSKKGEVEGSHENLNSEDEKKRERSRNKYHSAQRWLIALGENHTPSKTNKKCDSDGTKPRSQRRSNDAAFGLELGMSAPRRRKEESESPSKKGETNGSRKSVNSEGAKERGRSMSECGSDHLQRISTHHKRVRSLDRSIRSKSSEAEEAKNKSRRKSTDEAITLDLLRDTTKSPYKKADTAVDSQKKDHLEEFKVKKKSNRKTPPSNSVKDLDDFNLDTPTSTKTESTKNRRVRSLDLGILVVDDEDSAPTGSPRRGKKTPSSNSVKELDGFNLDTPTSTKTTKNKRVRSLDLGSLVVDDEDSAPTGTPRRGKKSPSQ
jgi:hypothetical protein